MGVSVENLRTVVREPGFIHTLSYVIANESLFGSREEVASRNRFELISYNEISLLISLLSEAPIDLTFLPREKVADQYSRCKSELETIHKEFIALSAGVDPEHIFSSGNSFIEPIYYAAGSAFWFDYLFLAPRLYELDKDFLVTRGYLVQDFGEFLHALQNVFRLRLREITRSERRKEKKGKLGDGPMPAFIFTSKDLDQKYSNMFETFFAKFAIEPGTAPLVKDPISYHPAKARPALRLDKESVFVPLVPMLCEQLFENPFYEIASDDSYFSLNANNRGIAAEQITADLLRTIQHFSILEDVKLYHKGDEVDQIDAAAVFGNTVILFETKTKRLTEAAKAGDTAKLVNDVRQGILDAKQQLANSKTTLLSKGYDRAASKSGDVASLAEVTKVVCVSIMIHEIPAYSFLIRTILEKENIEGIIPISVFDLKVMTRYLSNVFEFLYYFAARVVLDKHLMYGTEQSLLGFHLKTRLNVPENVDIVLVDDSYGQFVDADYTEKIFREKKGLSTDFGDHVVDSIVHQITRDGDAKLFRLFSVFRGMSGNAASELSGTIRKLEKMLLADGRAHDATMVFDKVALTVILGEGRTAIEAHARVLMGKRDLEKKYEQEYLLFLIRDEGTRRKESATFRRGLSKLVGRYQLIGVAMKQRATTDDKLLAFSPRVPRDSWEEASTTS